MRTVDNAPTVQALKPQWEKFVQAYLANGGDGGKAYSSVYPNCQKMEVASAAATRLLKAVKVRARLAELQAETAEESRRAAKCGRPRASTPVSNQCPWSPRTASRRRARTASLRWCPPACGWIRTGP